MTEIKGSIIKIDELKEFSSGFKKREIVLETEGQYPQKLLIQFVNDRAEILNKYKEGEVVNVSINLRGREWADPKTGEIKYFNSLEGWRIEYAGGDPYDGPPRSPEDLNTKSGEAEEDDLPF